jgi:hypothetical protein
MLITGSGDELCGLLPALFQAAAYHLPNVSPPAFPGFVYKSSHRDWLFDLPLLGALTAPCSLFCMFLFNSLFIIQFFGFFLWGGGQSV